MKKAERLNEELIYLSDKFSFQLKDIESEFKISKRTAIRDVEELEKMGLPIYSKNGRHGGYQIINQKLKLPILFNQQEIKAIFFAIDALKSLSNTPFDKSYKRINEKLLSTLPNSSRSEILNIVEKVFYHNIPPVSDIDNLPLILEAIINSLQLKLLYTQYEVENIQLQIYELFYRSGIWFCSAYDIENKKWGTYRCDYMECIEVVNNSKISFSEDEMKCFKNDYEKSYHNIDFRCRVTEFGRELFKKKNYPNMSLINEGNENYIVGGYNEEELPYMLQYLISLGKHVQIESPVELKDSYLKELKKIIKMY